MGWGECVGGEGRSRRDEEVAGEVTGGLVVDVVCEVVALIHLHPCYVHHLVGKEKR